MKYSKSNLKICPVYILNLNNYELDKNNRQKDTLCTKINRKQNKIFLYKRRIFQKINFESLTSTCVN